MASSIEGFDNIADEHFQSLVLDSTKTVLVEFYRDDCGSCRIFVPTLRELAERYHGRFALYRQNVSLGEFYKKKYNIAGEPSTAVFYGGELEGVVVGASAFATFEPQLQALLYKLCQKHNLPPFTRVK